MLAARVLPHSPRLARRTRDAFTLVEVLVVVAILVILAGAATVGIMKYLDDAKIDRTRMDAKAIHTAVKAYYTKNDQNWPSPDLSELVNPSLGRSYLEGGQASLVSPFQTPFQFSLVSNSNGEEEPFVYCQGPNGMTIGWPKAYEGR